jgi:hypothetical protein
VASNNQRLRALQAPEDLPLQEAVGRLIASIPLDDCIAIHETSRKRWKDNGPPKEPVVFVGDDSLVDHCCSTREG